MHRTKIALVFTLLLLILVLRFFFFYQNQPKYRNGQYVSFETSLLSEPQVLGNQQRFYANLDKAQRILITAPLYPQFHYGNTLHISSNLKYKTIKSQKAIMTMYFPKIEAIKKDQNLILSIANSIRQKAIALVEKTLSPTSASLLLGIVFGIKLSLAKDFTDNLRISGVFHVVAASGMNVTFVGGFLSSIFGFFLKRQIAVLFSIIGILFYAVLAGLEPSILRASIMGILVFSAQIIGRQNLGFYGLFIAGFAMLFWSPNLIFDIGFQLSFLATLGLLYIRPIFEQKAAMKNILARSIVGGDLATTIVAQLATFPILLSNFGTYSFWSVLVNGLVLWTIPIIMAIGGIGVGMGFIFDQAGQLILYTSLPFLLYFEKIIMFFGKMGGVVSIQNLPWQFTLGYYSLLGASILIFRKK